jgi:ParB/RepB/Spo0J family partition protein
MSNRTLDLRYVPIDLIHPNAWNPQTQDELTFQRLVDEIRDVGFVDPLEVVPLEDGTYRIIGGEHRWQAAKAAGLEELPCAVVIDKKWQDEDLQKFATVRLNVLKGKLDPEKFAKLYTEMAEKYGAESIQQLMGYVDTKGFQKLVGDVKRGMKKSLPKELQDEFDAQAKEAKTVEDLSNIIQHLFAKHGDTVGKSYMVFTYGKSEHIYIQADQKTKKALDKILAYCRKADLDINEVVGPELQKLGTSLLRELAAAEKTADAVEKAESKKGGKAVINDEF